MTRRKIYLLGCFLLSWLFSYGRQNEFIVKTKQEIFNIEKKYDTISYSLFDISDILNITLIFSFEQLLIDTSVAEIKYPGELVVHLSSHASDTISVTLSKRGRFRSKPENCDFPPLSISFKDVSPGSPFYGLKKLKMVTHCNTVDKDFEQYLFQEYLIYKLYSLLTDNSYRTRLAEVTYIDSKSQREIHTYTFFIENNKIMEKRLGGDLLNIKQAPVNLVDKESMARIIFFQYMIINNDWSVPIVHNIEIFSPDPFLSPIPIPFDFDWAGIIDIPYSTPLYTAKDGNTPQRRFKGPCMERYYRKQTVELFNTKREDIYSLYKSFPLLEKSQLERILESYDEFYNIINSHIRLHKELKHRCK